MDAQLVRTERGGNRIIDELTSERIRRLAAEARLREQHVIGGDHPHVVRGDRLAPEQERA